MAMWNPFVIFNNKPRTHAASEADRIVRRLGSARVKLRKDIRKIERAEKRIRSLLERQRILSETLVEDAASHREDVERAEEEMRRSEKALEQLRAENEVLENVVVPALTAGCKSIQERWNADIAVSGFRRAAATPRTEREEY